jgi:hypothetical protein
MMRVTWACPQGDNHDPMSFDDFLIPLLSFMIMDVHIKLAMKLVYLLHIASLLGPSPNASPGDGKLMGSD